MSNPVASTVSSDKGYSGNVGKEKNTFQGADYAIFALLLAVSASIGIFFAIRDRRKKHVGTQDYLMAGRKMTFAPVTLSIIATFMSSITILGVPVEYYVYGTMFTWYSLTYIVVAILTALIYLPIFYDLQITSTYEYIERRFDRATKAAISAMYYIVSLLYGGIVVYGPSLALSEVTGLDMWLSILSTGVVCIFYTGMGGLKAVIWTDVIQSLMMITGFIAVIIQGSINHGGFSNIWKAAEEGGRIDFVHFEPDPRIRHTFWSILFGGTVFWLAINAVNQAQVQRYLCIKTQEGAKKAIGWTTFGLIVILVLAGMTGLTIYATYRHCDPINSKAVGKSDQLFPFIVMDTLSYLPGMPGLFVAGVYSSSLSTISSGMNALACIALEDIVKPFTKWSPRAYLLTSKLLVVGFGVSYIMLAYLASVIGGLYRMGYRLNGIFSGPIVATFTMGMMLPFVNSWGALSGIIAGLSSALWVVIGSYAYPPTDDFLRPLPRSTAGCPSTVDVMDVGHLVNATTASVTYGPQSDAENRPPFVSFYSLSYINLSLIGFLSSVVVGIAVSACTGFTRNNPPEPNLLVTWVRPRGIKKKSEDVEMSRRAASDEKLPGELTPLHSNGETANNSIEG